MIVVEKDAHLVVIHHDHENRTLERILTGAPGAGGTSDTARNCSASLWGGGHPASLLSLIA
jgi:hypothetical protein